jgi:glucoamylase
LWNGILTEVYYPTVDRPQLRDLQYLMTDGESFFHEEKRNLKSSFQCLSDHAPGYYVRNSDDEGRYAIEKQIIANPHLSCILQHTRLTGEKSFLSGLKMYVLCAPHLEVGGYGNSGSVVDVAGRKLLVAERHGTWLALAATVPFSRVSCGYVGTSDGWTDLAHNFQMDWEFHQAPDGNIALTGELDLTETHEFTLGLAFGRSQHAAISTLIQSLSTPFAEHREQFAAQWERSCAAILRLGKGSGDGGCLYRMSFALLRAHEDKSYPGAFIASLAIPWGEVTGDENQGGYHVVWTRDMVNSATAMLAAGDSVTPLRALIFLNVSQQADGGFSQNFWINGEPYWRGVQLDETAFPILLAWRLWREKALQDFDPYPMVLRAAGYLVRHGPVTPQERWEEVSGYSPSTLASNIAALVCAASCARQRGDNATAAYLEEYADFLESHVEDWTVTTDGTLLAGVSRHYIRILPARPDNHVPDEDPNRTDITIANLPPDATSVFPAKEIVDAGFLELVRYGIRAADDPVIVDSLRVVDSVLKVTTPSGPCWHRYNHDGYGQREDGSAFQGWGRGGVWPLLTGERGHYEFAAGHDPTPFIRTMEGLASSGGLLPEQSWDLPDRPEVFMHFGRPTGSAMPLMWAHAEYVKLLRSINDGKVFDLIPDVAERYLAKRGNVPRMEVWKHIRQVQSVDPGGVLRIQATNAFSLRWSGDDWQTLENTISGSTALGVEFVDIPVPATSTIRFTFLWTTTGTWEGRDYQVSVKSQ